ncbi:hypothetical protein KJ836_02505 [Patescibacteria group bacterium]|nr:hypothetical protein [Patescibacteria group bacterium]
MQEKRLSVFKIRHALAEILAVANSVTVVLGELEKIIGYDSTYKRYRRIMNQFVNQGEFIQQSSYRYKLTCKGAIKLLPVIQPHLAKDGNIRILVFDIPETKRGVRNQFRNRIKMLDFRLHQRSVWVSRYDCEKWLAKIVEYYQLQGCVALYIGKRAI